MAGNRRLFQMPNIIILFTIGLVGQIIATPVNIPLSSVSDLIIQSALNSFNEQSPTKHTYKGGSLISAQKLSSPPYTTYRLTLNLEADCQSDNACPPEACSIDIKQHEQGVIEVVQESKQCTYLYPQSNSQLRETSDEQVIRRLEKLLNDTAELRREVQDVSDDNDRPFVAVRPSHYCPGCPYELNPTLPGLAAFGELAASSMDNSEGSDFKHRIVSFVRVFRAVPPGSTVVRYEFLVEVGETNCLRTTPIERSECPLQTNIPIRLCLIRVDEKPWIHNSRELTYNNCTDSDKINELNGKIETTLTSESLIKETAQEPSESADNYDQIALEGQISTFQSPYESPLPSQNTEDCLSQSAVSEVPFTKSVIETEDAQSETPKFTDKFKEFDEFLKDFDIPLKPTTEKLPQFHGPEVVEETIQPDRVELKEISEEQPSVEVTRKRRAVDNRKNYEKSFILKLAQKAMSRLDDMDNDDSKRVIADILDYKRIDDEGFLYQINVLAALTSNCKESHKNIKDCTHNPESQQMSICKLQIQTDEKSTIETSKIVVSQCYPIEDDRMRRKRSPPLAGSPNPVSVDDADVQDYVKKGLKKYSQGLQSANEPMIVEVVSATQQVVAGTIHRIKVKIGESNCPKGTVLPGNCLLLQSTPPKECEIKVWSKPWENFEEIDVTCDEKRKKRGVPGGVNEISVDHPDIQNYVQKGLKKYSTGLQSTNEPMVTKVLSATQQTVAGSLYKIKVQIGESNCPKGTVLPGDCLLLQNTPPKNCEISVWSKPWENFEQIDVTCDEKRKKRGLAGGVNEISVDHPDIQNYVRKGLKKYSIGLQSTNEPMVTKVLSATRQTVAGSLYKIKVQIGESSCPKGTVLPGNCLLLQSTPPKNCEISVWSKPWENFEKIDVTCDEKRKKRSLNRALRLKRGMLGAPQAISVDHVDVRNYVQKGLKKLSADVQGTNEPIPVEVLSATHQTVSGSLYKITVRVGDSNCPKGTTSMENCLLLKNSPIKECLITVWTKTWEKFEDIKVQCEPSSRRKRSLRGANYSQKMLGLGRQLEDERKFSEFQQRFNKVYASEEERAARFRIFQENMKIAENLQQYDQGTAEYGATMFADLTPHEFRSKYLGYRQDLRRENEIPMAQAKIPDVELPTEFDWRHYNVVTEVKDQGQCGSCWAFSVTGNIEGQYAIKHNKLISLSEQELVDCDKLDEGCNGGLQENAYRAIEQLGGLELENDYPYDAEDEKCHFKKNKAVVQVVSAVNITHNETQMAQWLVKNGPMAIAINANAMQFYMGGISHPFKFLCSGDSLDHGVLIVGYGVHTYPLFNKTMPYWIVKNSWGKRWGEQGYYRVYRGDGTCGVNADVSSAIIA